MNIYGMTRTLLAQPLSSKSKRCALDLQVRFRLFNLALTILRAMRLYSSTFKDHSDIIEFQYQAYGFIWQYFGNKSKFCTRNSGQLLQNDVHLIKETLELLNTDTNMMQFCADPEGGVNKLNGYVYTVHGCKGTCRFSAGEPDRCKEAYRVVQSPVCIPGGHHADIQVQELPDPVDIRS